jgi:hypothetical protein
MAPPAKNAGKQKKIQAAQRIIAHADARVVTVQAIGTNTGKDVTLLLLEP